MGLRASLAGNDSRPGTRLSQPVSNPLMPPLWDRLARDIRHAVRGFLRAPGFTVTALAAIAIGAGASTAVFSVVDRILFRPLPYADDTRLVSIGFIAPLDNSEFILGADYYEWRRERTAFDGMTSWSMATDCDLNAATPERLTCARVEANFIDVLGVAPIIGRNFTREEDRPDGPKAVMLTYGYWRSHYASNPAVTGQVIRLDGVERTIAGVLPREFEMPRLNRVDLLIPQALNEAGQQRPNTGAVLRGFARLKPGVTVDQAKAALAGYFARTLEFVPPAFRKEVHLAIRPLRDLQTQDARAASWTLLGAVLAVLLIGAANVANLLLARSAARQRELAVRSALGASRGRLLAERLTESLLLAAAGGILGCALAWALLRIFASLAPDGILRLDQATLDGRVLGFTLVVTAVAGLLFGLAPAFRMPGTDLLTGSRAAGFRRNTLGHAILAGQIAASLILLAAAGLLLRSFWKLQASPLGFRPAQVFAVPLVLGPHQYPDAARRVQFFEEVERRARQLAGADSTALSDSIPPSGGVGSMIHSLIEVQGRPRVESGTGGMVAWRSVTPGFFETLGIPILRGRGFIEQDRDPNTDSVIIGEALARQLFARENPLGHSLRFGKSGPWYNVVGVAGDIRNKGLAAAGDPEYYVARKHLPDAGTGNRVLPDAARRAVLLVRSRMRPEAVVNLIRAELASVDRGLPVSIETMDARVSKLAARPRFNATLLAVFAGVGVLLAAIGLYGVMSLLVAQRTQEIGVRMALGATRAGITTMVLRHAARWTAVGCVVGLAGSLALTRVLRALLFDAPVQDPGALAGSAVVLIAVAFGAAWLPSRRAATVDPMEALRHD